MCLYYIECEIPELSNILDCTVVFAPPPFSPEFFLLYFTFAHSAVFYLACARATPKTKEVKSFNCHRIARLRTPPACIRYRLFIFLAKRRAIQVGHYLYRTSAVFRLSGSATCREKRPVPITIIEILKSDKCHRYGS